MHQNKTTYAEHERTVESVEITRDQTMQLFISRIDLDYSYGQMKLSEETSRQCVCALTGRKFSGYYRFKKGLYGLADIPTTFQKKLTEPSDTAPQLGWTI